MRSRDGNSSYLLAIFSIVFFYSLSLQASEYLISYRYVVKDAILYNESLQISSAMKKCSGSPRKSLLLSIDDNQNLQEIIKLNAQEFIDFLHKIGLNVEHKEKTINYINHSTTILTLKTTCFKVDINENFAIISPLK